MGLNLHAAGCERLCFTHHRFELGVVFLVVAIVISFAMMCVMLVVAVFVTPRSVLIDWMSLPVDASSH